jgi:hypothetical protein
MIAPAVLRSSAPHHTGPSSRTELQDADEAAPIGAASLLVMVSPERPINTRRRTAAVKAGAGNLLPLGDASSTMTGAGQTPYLSGLVDTKRSTRDQKYESRPGGGLHIGSGNHRSSYCDKMSFPQSTGRLQDVFLPRRSHVRSRPHPLTVHDRKGSHVQNHRDGLGPAHHKP